MCCEAKKGFASLMHASSDGINTISTKPPPVVSFSYFPQSTKNMIEQIKHL